MEEKTSASLGESAFYDNIQETVDTCLEKVDIHLDAHLGLNRNDRVATNTSKPKSNRKSKSASNAMFKPQKKFKRKPDNSHDPWVPTLTWKPNAKVPLQDYSALLKSPQLAPEIAAHLKGMGMDVEQSSKVIPHPYEPEISALEYEKAPCKPVKEQLYGSLKKVPCHWVDTLPQLEELAEKLTEVETFAVDLEHHDYRTYLGIVCLMQISTRDEDFLIDTLALHDDMHVLNPAFTDPSIVKVLHGADRDVLWLQRDFGIYVVNMFDTGQATRYVLYCEVV